MPKRTLPHEEFLAEYLQDPREAVLYLNAALEDSEESFLEAIGDVAATVATMAEVADRAGVARQAAYRMLSRSGNPTCSNLMAILRALGLRFVIEADIASGGTGPSKEIRESRFGESHAETTITDAHK
jgi:probable addiction module antidote protein